MADARERVAALDVVDGLDVGRIVGAVEGGAVEGHGHEDAAHHLAAGRVEAAGVAVVGTGAVHLVARLDFDAGDLGTRVGSGGAHGPADAAADVEEVVARLGVEGGRRLASRSPRVVAATSCRRGSSSPWRSTTRRRGSSLRRRRSSLRCRRSHRAARRIWRGVVRFQEGKGRGACAV